MADSQPFLSPSLIEQDGVIAVVRLNDLSKAVPLTEAPLGSETKPFRVSAKNIHKYLGVQKFRHGQSQNPHHYRR